MSDEAISVRAQVEITRIINDLEQRLEDNRTVHEDILNDFNKLKYDMARGEYS